MLKNYIAPIFISVLLWASIGILSAQEAGPKNNLSLTATSAMELQMGYAHQLEFPVLTGASPLLSGNKLALNFAGNISPVSFGADLEARLTPVAFLQIFAGAGALTAWNIPIANGLRKNHRQGEGPDNTIEGDYGFYQDRLLNTAQPLRLEFYRIAAIISWEF